MRGVQREDCGGEAGEGVGVGRHCGRGRGEGEEGRGAGGVFDGHFASERPSCKGRIRGT